jgi:hypothetical protein
MRKTSHPHSLKQLIKPDRTGVGPVRLFFSKILPYKGWLRTFVPFLLIALILSITSTARAAWYDPNWQYRKAITIDGSRVAGGPHVDFPVLISITDTDLSAARADGWDLLFTDSDETTKLDHEIESFNNGSGVLVAWVRIPAPGITNGTDKTIYLYYGYPTVPADQQNVNGVWNANYEAVWHLKEDPSDTAPQMNDSTSSPSHGTSYGTMTTTDQVPGKINGSLDFDGSDDEIRMSNAIIGDDASFTITAWIQTGDYSVHRTIYSEGNTSLGGYLNLYVGDDAGGFVKFYIDNTGSDYPEVFGTTNVEDNQPHFIALVQRSKTNRELFVDSVSESAGVPNTENSGTLTHDVAAIGFLRTDWGADSFTGILDEVRISNIDRSNDWITTEYNNQSNPGTGGFLSSVGPQEGGNVLLIVSNSSSPDASDQALKTYLESNGLTVFYADDDDADYNPAITANNINVVYVSTSAGSSAVGDKTRDLTVGVVQANGGNWDNQLLHCSGSSTQTDGTDLNLVDNSHYITQPFGTGVFAAYSSTGSLNWGDDLGTGAQVLIQMDGQPTQGALVVYDTNSELCDTSSAPARRVGIHTDDVFSLWTATTQTLVLRSLLWAGGTGGAGGGDSLTLADHASGQVSDRLTSTSPLTDTLFQFELTRSGTVTVDNVRLNFTTGGGVANGDVSGGELWEDTNGNGAIDVGDALIEGGVTPVVGVLTFTTDFTPATTGTTYFVRATVANLVPGDTTTLSLGTADIDEVEGGVTESGSITNATHTQDASLQINYRSIGTAADYSANTVTVTNGSPVVDGSGTAWQTANRGQGDRITIDGGEYTILSVDSQTQLTLARPFTGIGGAGKAYTIARHFTTLTEWEDCISFAGCPALYPFSPSSASLVADNRQEIGIGYSDSVFTERLIIDGSTTDATRNITLTVASGNRHNGTAGTGVVLDPAAGGDALIVQDDYTRIEWLEVTGWPGGGDDGLLIDADLTSYAYMIVHDGGDGDSDGFRLKENSGNWTATVRNSIAYNRDALVSMPRTIKELLRLCGTLRTSRPTIAAGVAQAAPGPAGYQLPKLQGAPPSSMRQMYFRSAIPMTTGMETLIST